VTKCKNPEFQNRKHHNFANQSIPNEPKPSERQGRRHRKFETIQRAFERALQLRHTLEQGLQDIVRLHQQNEVETWRKKQKSKTVIMKQPIITVNDCIFLPTREFLKIKEGKTRAPKIFAPTVSSRKNPIGCKSFTFFPVSKPEFISSIASSINVTSPALHFPSPLKIRAVNFPSSANFSLV